MVGIDMGRRAALVCIGLLVLTQSLPSEAAAPPEANLLDWVDGRDDLSRRARRRWRRAVKLRFGGASMHEDIPSRPEIRVAKSILASAIFMGAKPKAATDAAWEGWRGALGYVPPPIAIHYQLLVLQGRKPRGRPIDLAFDFPEYFDEEIAPELVAYWQTALEQGKVPDDALMETQEALQATRLKMRPLLLDKLRLMARLDRERSVASAGRKAEIQRDLDELEGELRRSFSKVTRRAAVLDRRRRPYDRLLIALEDMGLKATDDDHFLDPGTVPPPPIDVPAPPEPEVRRSPDGTPLAEPSGPPPDVLPQQARPGMRPPSTDPVLGRSPEVLAKAYARRIRDSVMGWLGTPYRWGADKRRAGTDCSGFVRRLYADTFRVQLPRVSKDQYRVGESVSRRSLRAGDLVFFDTADSGRINHVGVFVGGKEFIHASATHGVVYAKLDSRYYRRAYRGARRILNYPR